MNVRMNEEELDSKTCGKHATNIFVCSEKKLPLT